MGLSHVSGDLVFDRSRMLFDRISAQAGGGQLQLNGAVNYGEGPLRYELNVSTTVVRIRYPAGMSWLASGALQLSGSSTAAILSGKIQIQRLLLAEGVDLGALFTTASETSATPASSSTLMRNLTFDIEGQTTPGARIQWTGAQLEVDGNVRLRGTWDRPVLLGHIHLLGGEMAFRGNNYTLTRGDVNFANPFRLDPVLNIEATSTIGQYQVTINFSGEASHLYAQLSFRSAVTGFGHHRAARDRQPRAGERIAVIQLQALKIMARPPCFQRQFRAGWAGESKSFSVSAISASIHSWRARRRNQTLPRA